MIKDDESDSKSNNESENDSKSNNEMNEIIRVRVKVIMVIKFIRVLVIKFISVLMRLVSITPGHVKLD